MVCKTSRWVCREARSVSEVRRRLFIFPVVACSFLLLKEVHAAWWPRAAALLGRHALKYEARFGDVSTLMLFVEQQGFHLPVSSMSSSIDPGTNLVTIPLLAGRDIRFDFLPIAIEIASG